MIFNLHGRCGVININAHLSRINTALSFFDLAIKKGYIYPLQMKSL